MAVALVCSLSLWSGEFFLFSRRCAVHKLERFIMISMRSKVANRLAMVDRKMLLMRERVSNTTVNL